MDKVRKRGPRLRGDDGGSAIAMAEVESAARCVWDFTTGDARRFCDRLALVIDTGEDFQKRGIACDFVLLLHGAATQFGARTLSGTKFDKPDAADLAPAHALLRRFARMGGRIVCAASPWNARPSPKTTCSTAPPSSAMSS